jgi:glycosyltransferase involved in cell wall biosynthesis
VLILGIYYAPEETANAPYTAGTAEHLATSGYDVTVVTGFPHYPEWEVWGGYRRRLRMRERLNGVDVHRRWHYVPKTQSAAQRALYEGTFCASSFAATLPHHDAVLAVVPTLGAAVQARLAARRFGVPYGILFQDLSGRAAEQSGISGGGKVARVVRAVEGWVARDAAEIGIIAEGFRPYLERLGVAPHRIQRIRNWTHIDPATKDPYTVRRDLDLPLDATICLHAGNMGFKQGLENVLEAARAAKSTDPDLLFVLMGGGNQRAHLEELSRAWDLTNLRFLPIQPKEEFPNVLGAADVLLVNQRETVSDMSLPGKLTAYFASGRPIAAAVADASETAIELRDAGAGLVVTPGDPAALLGAIRAIAADSTLAERLGSAGRRFASERLTSDVILGQYEQLFGRLIEHGRQSRVAEPESARR